MTTEQPPALTCNPEFSFMIDLEVSAYIHWSQSGKVLGAYEVHSALDLLNRLHQKFPFGI